MRKLTDTKKLNETICPLSFGAGPYNCVGPKCMLWRFATAIVPNVFGAPTASHDTHGHCSLTGSHNLDETVK